MPIETPKLGQGPGKVASQEDESRQNVGFTGPNLHRVIDAKEPIDPLETKPREYVFSIQGYDSYRTTEIFYHDEEQTDSEVP